LFGLIAIYRGGGSEVPSWPRFSFEWLDEGDSTPRPENGYREAVLSDDKDAPVKVGLPLGRHLLLRIVLRVTEYPVDPVIALTARSLVAPSSMMRLVSLATRDELIGCGSPN
jgi:hypothetical protein